MHANRYETLTHCVKCKPAGFVNQRAFPQKDRPSYAPSAEAGGQTWAIGSQYFPHIYVRCDEYDCLGRAVALWTVLENPSQKWNGCEKCQKAHFGGWPEEYGPVGEDVEDFYNNRVSVRIFLVAFSRFKAIVEMGTGTEQQMQAGVEAFPDDFVGNAITVGSLLSFCYQNGDVMGNILRYLR